ncbi:methylenetetrahydrofolate reductase C-terminal domain-containing protein [Billgrantia gudaonensis]|uniref:Methylene-tetrahydrofolate reductase C terminal n=1 Tax=Billgrantia gudaonensis TaxID=376427 RepID=A0A1G8SLS7_9GAMM|nr:methylenetetrahydrofolate reductase C-terminal domain-containing protein [Halomonas gudaonensis]SDJ30199.1 Methylene-tetrahydrofolate reductase C terminal [Halomonas gudaonensis]
MYAVRRWVVRHARGFERLYQAFEPLLVKLHPVWRRIGYDRAEAPVAAVEKGVKGVLFDCRMCGQCVLSSTGMSCPMNCPKNLRNGPCGGVRQDGGCEVVPEMRCVWIDAWEGSRRMRYGDRIQVVQEPVDHRLQGSSSWLRVVRERAEEARQSSQGGAET